MCFHWLVLTVSASARETDGLALLQYVSLSDPFLEMRRESLRMTVYHMTCTQKKSHLHFLNMLRYVQG